MSAKHFLKLPSCGTLLWVCYHIPVCHNQRKKANLGYFSRFDKQQFNLPGQHVNRNHLTGLKWVLCREFQLTLRTQLLASMSLQIYKCCHLLPHTTHTLSSLCDKAVKSLFDSIITNSRPTHPLHILLPPKVEKHYSTHPRGHCYELPRKTSALGENTFFYRLLYRDILSFNSADWHFLFVLL